MLSFSHRPPEDCSCVGPASRCPEAPLSALIDAGITTLVGVLGTDSVSRSQAWARLYVDTGPRRKAAPMHCQVESVQVAGLYPFTAGPFLPQAGGAQKSTL